MDLTAGFEGDNGFVLVHAIISYFLCVLAFILNSIVFFLVRKADAFRFVFNTYCIANLISAVGSAISLTQWIQIPGLSIFFSTGPFSHSHAITAVVLRVIKTLEFKIRSPFLHFPHSLTGQMDERMQTLMYFFVMCLLCATFIYRYFVVTRSNVNKAGRRACIALSFTSAALWIADRTFTMEPDEGVRKYLNREFGTKYAVNFEQMYFFAIATSAAELNTMKIVGISCTFVQLIVIIFTGFKMNKTIQESVGSQKTKIMERSAFRLLLSQAINPMIFLHIPSFLNFYQAEIHALPDLVNQILCIMMTVFPVTNPLCNIIFSAELRNALKYRILRRKKSSIAQM